MTNFVVALFRSDLVTEQPCTKAYCRSGRRMVQFSRKGVPSSMSHSGGLRNSSVSETNCSPSRYLIRPFPALTIRLEWASTDWRPYGWGTLTAVSTSLALFQIQLKRHRHIRVCVRGGEPKRPEELEKG